MSRSVQTYLLETGRAVIRQPKVKSPADLRKIFTSPPAVKTKETAVILPLEATQKLSGIHMLDLNASVYAGFLNALAKVRQVADRLFELGLGNKVTPQALIERHGDVFTKSGLTPECADDIFVATFNANLPPKEISALEFLTTPRIWKNPLFDVLGLTNETAKKEDMPALCKRTYPIALAEFQLKFRAIQEKCAWLNGGKFIQPT